MTRYEYYEKNDGEITDAHIAHYGKKGMRWGVRNERKRVGKGVRKLGKKLNEGYEKAYLNPRKEAKKNLVEKHRKAGNKRLAKMYEKTPDEGLDVAVAKKIGSNAIKGAKMSAQATKRVGEAAAQPAVKAKAWAKRNPSAVQAAVAAVAVSAVYAGGRLAYDSAVRGTSMKKYGTSGMIPRTTPQERAVIDALKSMRR